MMKRYVLVFAVLFLSLQLFAQSRVDVIREKILSCDQSSVIVVAHRGDWRNFPENSLEAIDNAIKMGVDVVELDVKQTKDSVLILMHDKTLNRTTTGKGKVSDVTMDYISGLKLKNGLSSPTIHKVPTLEEALLRAKGKIMINLDQTDPYIEEVFAMLEKMEMTDHIIMKSGKSTDEIKALYGDCLDKVIFMPIINLDSKDEDYVRNMYKEFEPMAYEFVYAKSDNSLPLKIKEIMADKALLWYNTMTYQMAAGHDDDMSLSNPDAGYGYLIDILGARIIQTDRPAALLEYLRTRGLHD